jgi:hypothetical protein
MWSVKEGAPSFEDFAEQKTVLISDEAHHLTQILERVKKEATMMTQKVGSIRLAGSSVQTAIISCLNSQQHAI